MGKIPDAGAARAGHMEKNHTPGIKTVSEKPSVLHAAWLRGWFRKTCNFGISGPQWNFFSLSRKSVYSFKK